MEDYKGMLAELAELAKWIVEHAAIIDRALTEKKYNDMLNEEVR